MKTCNKDHRKDQMFEILPASQTYYAGRHKCAGCAYEQGVADGTSGVEPNFRPEEILDSQAQSVRHRSALAAYMMGYTDGLRG